MARFITPDSAGNFEGRTWSRCMLLIGPIRGSHRPRNVAGLMRSRPRRAKVSCPPMHSPVMRARTGTVGAV